MSKLVLPADTALNLSGNKAEETEGSANSVGTDSGLLAAIQNIGASFHHWSGRYSVLVTIFAITLAYLLLLRTVMVITYTSLDKVTLWQELQLFFVGFQYDVLVALCFVIPQLIHITLLSEQRLQGRINRLLLDL
ncbi:MAG: hypothetical protein KDA70_21830, partial [Planctomycetaceae bacterium]|nr:hypothetical protein [Planctomycetaceae bacterium]